MGEREGAHSSFRTIAVLTLIPIVALLALFGWNLLNGGAPPEDILRIDTQPDHERMRTASPGSETVTIPELPAAPRVPNAARVAAGAAASARSTMTAVTRGRASGAGTLVLIIDDLGFEGQPLDRVMALDPNLSLSVLPNGDSATEFATKLHGAGFEVLCHLPMEPLGDRVSPGKGALLTSMSDAELAAATQRSVQAIPYASGVNNHMGSKATRDRRVMQSVLRALPAGLYFVDSRTTGGSVAYDTARSLQIPTATRDVFLDDTPTEAAVEVQLERAIQIALSGRTAIAIGHPHKPTLAVLERELPRMRARGVRIIRASAAVH
jgi:uncharacterized protein